MNTRKLALTTGVALIVASSAFATGFTINDGAATLDDISSGTTDITTCTDGILLDVVSGQYDAKQNDWPVIGITVSSNDKVSLHEKCAGFGIRAVIEVVASQDKASVVSTESTVVGQGKGELFLPVAKGQTVWVKEAEEVSVEIDHGRRPTNFTSEAAPH